MSTGCWPKPFQRNCVCTSEDCGTVALFAKPSKKIRRAIYEDDLVFDTGTSCKSNSQSAPCSGNAQSSLCGGNLQSAPESATACGGGCGGEEDEVWSPPPKPTPKPCPLRPPPPQSKPKCGTTTPAGLEPPPRYTSGKPPHGYRKSPTTPACQSQSNGPPTCQAQKRFSSCDAPSKHTDSKMSSSTGEVLQRKPSSCDNSCGGQDVCPFPQLSRCALQEGNGWFARLYTGWFTPKRGGQNCGKDEGVGGSRPPPPKAGPDDFTVCKPAVKRRHRIYAEEVARPPGCSRPVGVNEACRVNEASCPRNRPHKSIGAPVPPRAASTSACRGDRLTEVTPADCGNCLNPRARPTFSHCGRRGRSQSVGGCVKGADSCEGGAVAVTTAVAAGIAVAGVLCLAGKKLTSG